MKLGINGLGRIGKLSLWHHVSHKHFSEIVIDTSAETRHELKELTTGKDMMGADSAMLTTSRFPYNSREISWQQNRGRLVMDTTGVFTVPTAKIVVIGSTLRGHLQAGAKKVLVSPPVKTTLKGPGMPEHAVPTAMGIHEENYDVSRHTVVSTATCTTSWISSTKDPRIEHGGAKSFPSASMVTVHAAPGSQQVLDRLPDTEVADLEKNPIAPDKIPPTTTNAAKPLTLVIPEMNTIGFMAESAGMPIGCDSPIIPGATRHDAVDSSRQHFEIITIPRESAASNHHRKFSRTTTRLADPTSTQGVRQALYSEHTLPAPVPQSVIYDWYDNELGRYTNLLGNVTVQIGTAIH